MNIGRDSQQYKFAAAVVEKLRGAGFEAYLVGGCVRDMLLGREPCDYDVTTSAQPEEVEALFEHTVPVGRQFGIVIVSSGDFQFQVATFRSEAGYTDGRHPETVTFSSAKEDARRRDFTINGLFFDPIQNEVYDWVGGRADLAARLVRTIGHPVERFSEDHLRLLRAVRFAAELDFEIEERTFDAVRRLAAQITRISAERIRDELIKLFRPPHAARGLVLLERSGLLREILPEVDAFVTCNQSPPYHPEGTVFQHVRIMLSLLPPDAHPSLPWAVLLHDVGKPAVITKDPRTGQLHFYEHEQVGATAAEAILTRLRFPRKQIDEIVEMVLRHMQFKDAKRMKKSTVRRVMGRPTFPIELELHRLDCLASHGELESHAFFLEQAAALVAAPPVPPPLVRGRDLIEMGMEQGPAIGTLLGEIQEKYLEGELTTREEALAWARQRMVPGSE